MTFQASIHGRLTNEPKEIITSTGNSMALCNIAISLDCNERDIDDKHTEFISIVSFGKVADSLLRHRKGDMISMAGEIRYKTYNDERQMVIMAESCHSAKTIQPIKAPIEQNKPIKRKAKQSSLKVKKVRQKVTPEAIKAAKELLNTAAYQKQSEEAGHVLPFDEPELPFNDKIPF